jgi:glycosyltransferase involved in cell wall biosynthesis
MRLLQIYNQYRSLFGGEETVVRRISHMAEENGVEARLLMRSSRGLDASFRGRSRAFLSGIYNPFARRDVARLVNDFGPDVVHVHNLYPLFSPSILGAVRSMGVPIVMTVHNHFHTCPNADHVHGGLICTKCTGGREYFCAVENCRGNLLESIAYALRSTTARKLGLFTRNVTITIALNEFARQRLVTAGFPPDRVVVLPNSAAIPDEPANPGRGSHAVFSGRLVPEKGAGTLVAAAQRCPDIPVRFLGDGPEMAELRGGAPSNAHFCGQVDAAEVAAAYRGARFLVIPSRWFEGCPLVILEAMSFGLPVIASRIGGLPELVEEGVTGMLFEPGDSEELAEKMQTLWQDPGLCQAMGDAGRRRAIEQFNERDYWRKLSSIYESAMAAARSSQQA